MLYDGLVAKKDDLNFIGSLWDVMELSESRPPFVIIIIIIRMLEF